MIRVGFHSLSPYLSLSGYNNEYCTSSTYGLHVFPHAATSDGIDALQNQMIGLELWTLNCKRAEAWTKQYPFVLNAAMGGYTDTQFALSVCHKIASKSGHSL